MDKKSRRDIAKRHWILYGVQCLMVISVTLIGTAKVHYAITAVAMVVTMVFALTALYIITNRRIRKEIREQGGWTREQGGWSQ